MKRFSIYMLVCLVFDILLATITTYYDCETWVFTIIMAFGTLIFVKLILAR